MQLGRVPATDHRPPRAQANQVTIESIPQLHRRGRLHLYIVIINPVVVYTLGRLKPNHTHKHTHPPHTLAHTHPHTHPTHTHTQKATPSHCNKVEPPPPSGRDRRKSHPDSRSTGDQRGVTETLSKLLAKYR